MSHDGYARRHGLIHRRLLILSPNGRELRGEDLLLPAPRARRKGDKGFTMRFHLGRNISASLTADKLGALLRVGGGPLWQFRTSERSEEHTSELQSLMRISYAVFCLNNNPTTKTALEHTLLDG